MTRGRAKTQKVFLEQQQQKQPVHQKVRGWCMLASKEGKVQTRIELVAAQRAGRRVFQVQAVLWMGQQQPFRRVHAGTNGSVTASIGGPCRRQE